MGNVVHKADMAVNGFLVVLSVNNGYEIRRYPHIYSYILNKNKHSMAIKVGIEEVASCIMVRCRIIMLVFWRCSFRTRTDSWALASTKISNYPGLLPSHQNPANSDHNSNQACSAMSGGATVNGPTDGGTCWAKLTCEIRQAQTFVFFLAFATCNCATLILHLPWMGNGTGLVVEGVEYGRGNRLAC